MSHAITSTCAFGFILRDLNQEFASRLADKLLLSDKKVKASGSTNILNRAKLGALIGEGNSHFIKYSLLGHVYLLICIIIEEVCKRLPKHDEVLQNSVFEVTMSRKNIYKQLAFFPKEISAYKLSASVREALRKFKNDYKTSSFFNLIEWRISLSDLESNNPVYPQECNYKVLIHNHNVYVPQVLLSM